MYLFLMLICGAVGYWLYPAGIADIPLSQLTLSKIFSCLWCGVFWVGAIACIGPSLERDGIWPWNWKGWRDPATLVIRLAAICFMSASFHELHFDQLSGLRAVLVTCSFIALILFIMFSSELKLKPPQPAPPESQTEQPSK